MRETRMKKLDRVEKFIDIDDSLLEAEKSSNMIRLDMNIVEFPVFSKNARRKKNQIMTYYFKADKSQYLEIEPNQGYSIPGDFEERVFIALIKIMRDNHYPRTFYVSANEIIEASGTSDRSNKYKKIKQAMKTLANNTYRFKDILYSSEKKGILEGETETHILDITSITAKKASGEDLNHFTDKRIKEIYKVSLADQFFDNIVKKGYLVFDSDKLLQISDSVTRSIFTLLEKWRIYDLYLRRPVVFLVKKIPLAWDSRSYGRTVKGILAKCDELKEMGLIKDYNFKKNGKWEKSEIEFFFEESHNKYKRGLFYEDKSAHHNQNMLVAHTESRGIDIIRENPHALDEILFLFPPRARNLINMPKTIEKALNKYDYDYVYRTAEYTAKNCNSAYYSYFKKALIENWAADYISKKKVSIAKSEKTKQDKIKVKAGIEEAIIVKEVESNYEEFLNLSEDKKELIKEKAYRLYLEDSKTQDNATTKRIFSNESVSRQYIKKVDIPEVLSEGKKVNVVEDEYSTISKFSLKLLKIFKEKEFDIDLEDFFTLFNIVKKYEDENVKIMYDEESKIGRIEYK